jgi:hypothetical protein
MNITTQYSMADRAAAYAEAYNQSQKLGERKVLLAKLGYGTYRNE